MESFTYDLLGRLTGHSSPLGSFALSYLGQTGQVVRRALPPTTNQPWTVDWTYGDNLADRRLEAIDHSPQPNSGARNYAYTTSPEHRILGLTESTAVGATATWTYTYDLADRLTQALSSLVGPYGYELDAGDNLLSVQTPPGIATSTYDSLNQIDLRNGQPFTYDAAGNLLDDGQRSYAWDAAQRLVRIRYPGATRSTEFRYDGLGRRTAVREYPNSYNFTETRYLWCGERICQARNGSDTVIRRYYDEGELGPNAYYYAQDHLGSVRDLVNTNGQVVASYDYDPYGNPTRTVESGSARADYRYAGLFYHQPSGLYLTHYRVYDPVTARWLSRDPIGEKGGANLYTYVGNSPLTFIDPIGLFQMCHRDLQARLPYARHCYVQYADGSTSSYDPKGVQPDPDPDQKGKTCTDPQQPEKDECIRRVMQQCNGQNYSFTKFNCCHCVEQALKECNSPIPPSAWPNWPVNPGPQPGEPSYSPVPTYGPSLGQ